MILNPFFNSRFGYCPLILMFDGRMANNKINKLHERYLRIIYSENFSSYEEILEEDGFVSLHHRSLRILATEMFGC